MRARAEVRSIRAHHVVLRRQKCAIACALVHVPWRQHRGAAPLRRIVEETVLRLEDHILRRNLGTMPASGPSRRCVSANVARGCRIEPRKIEVVKHRRRHQVRFFKPAQLLAMRAIGKQAHRIVLDGVQNQRVNAIRASRPTMRTRPPAATSYEPPPRAGSPSAPPPPVAAPSTCTYRNP